MNKFEIFSIGKIKNKEGEIKIVLDAKYKKGLQGLEGFSHVQILWWMDECDNDMKRSIVIEEKPYKNGPYIMGVFSLRSPERPNPIGVSSVDIEYIDIDNGIIGLYYIDAFDNTNVIDIKPYTPSIDKIENAKTPSWCKHWPKSYEESSSFDWESEFNF